MFAPPPERIIWCYSMFQKSYEPFTKLAEFTDVVPKPETFTEDRRTLLVLDDLMHETDGQIEQLFTRVSHHRNLTVVYITQNLFSSSKRHRTMSLNAHYLVLFKNVRDASQISVLGRQMYPKRYEHVIEAYRDATGRPYGYLVIDLRPETEDSLRLRTDVFPDEITYAYVAK
jgi:hypothetical protein